MTGPGESVEASRERFRVSYPFPIAMGAILWVIMWLDLGYIIASGGLRPRDPGVATTIFGWVLYAFAVFVGPLGVFSYSASLEVDGSRLLWKRWFGLSSLPFDRAEIREARIERTRRSRRVCIFLHTGLVIRFTQYAWNFTRLGRYLGVLPVAE